MGSPIHIATNSKAPAKLRHKLLQLHRVRDGQGGRMTWWIWAIGLIHAAVYAWAITTKTKKETKP